MKTKLATLTILKTIKTIVVVSALALMTACGGGGDGGGAPKPVVSTESFPLKTAYENFLKTPLTKNATLSGIYKGDAVTGSGTITFSSVSAGIFEGVAAQQKTTTSTASLFANGKSTPLNNSFVTWFDSNFVQKGEIGISSNYYNVVTVAPTIPTMVRVNDTGTLYTANIYSDSTKAALRGTETVTYAIEADTASTALVTFITTVKNNLNITTATVSNQIRITPMGVLTLVKEITVQDTTNLIVTY